MSPLALPKLRARLFCAVVGHETRTERWTTPGFSHGWRLTWRVCATCQAQHAFEYEREPADPETGDAHGDA